MKKIISKIINFAITRLFLIMGIIQSILVVFELTNNVDRSFHIAVFYFLIDIVISLEIKYQYFKNKK